MTELALYEQFARYVNLKYPHIAKRMHFDLSGVNNKSKYTRSLYSRLNGRAFPDFALYFPVTLPGAEVSYHGLFIEIKKDGTKLQTRDGRWATPHIAEQAEVLDALQECGYVAQFAVGLNECEQLIDSYLGAGLPVMDGDGSVF